MPMHLVKYEIMLCGGATYMADVPPLLTPVPEAGTSSVTGFLPHQSMHILGIHFKTTQG